MYLRVLTRSKNKHIQIKRNESEIYIALKMRDLSYREQKLLQRSRGRRGGGREESIVYAEHHGERYNSSHGAWNQNSPQLVALSLPIFTDHESEYLE